MEVSWWPPRTGGFSFSCRNMGCLEHGVPHGGALRALGGEFSPTKTGSSSPVSQWAPLRSARVSPFYREGNGAWLSEATE